MDKFLNNTAQGRRAFTLIELLVVMGIMVLLAGMIVGLSGVVGDRKIVNQTRAEIERVATLIETYKAKKGYYPPHNPSNWENPTNTSLYYELAGAELVNANEFETPFGVRVTRTILQNACGVGGIANAATTPSVEDRAEVLQLLRQVKPSQTNRISVNGSAIFVLVAPAEGPDGRKINPLFYRVGSETNNAHNPGSFDLWAEVKIGKQTKIIGNWKD